MTDHEKHILRRYAKNGMNISKTAREFGYSFGGLLYYLKKIKRHTGHDPRDFWGLAELLKEDTAKNSNCTSNFCRMI